MSNFTVRFELYGDLIVEAETARDAERQAADSLITWGGAGTVADDAQVEGVTILDGMTQEQP